MNKKRSYIFPLVLVLLIPASFSLLIFAVAKMLEWEIPLYHYDKSELGHPAPPIVSIMAGALLLGVLMVVWFFFLMLAYFSFKRIRLNNKLFYLSGIKDNSIPAEGEYIISRKRNKLKVALRYIILMIVPILTYKYISHTFAAIYVIFFIILAVKSLSDADLIPQSVRIDKKSICMNDKAYEFENISKLLFTVSKRSLDIYNQDSDYDRVYLGTFDGAVDSGTLAVLITIIRACSEKDIIFDFQK